MNAQNRVSLEEKFWMNKVENFKVKAEKWKYRLKNEDEVGLGWREKKRQK